MTQNPLIIDCIYIHNLGETILKWNRSLGS